MGVKAGRDWSAPRALRSLWTAVLLGPIAWALNLTIGYAMSAFACSGVWTASFHAATFVTLALAAAGARLAWKLWRQTGEHRATEGSRLERSRFMALAGIGLSAYFGFAILAQWIPTFFYEPCRY